MSRKTAFHAAGLLCGVLAAAPAQAGSYSFTTIDPPASLGINPVPNALNNSGQVVGSVIDPVLRQPRGFVWQNGVATVFDGASTAQHSVGGTELYAVNESGIAVGYDRLGAMVYRVADGSIRHPLLAAGLHETPPRPRSQFNDINNHNVVAGVGSFGTFNRPMIDGVIVTGLSVDRPTYTAFLSVLLQINDDGEVLGLQADNSQTNTYFTLKSGTVQNVLLPSNKYSYVYLAKNGRIFGSIELLNRDNKLHGFFITDAGFEEITYPGSDAFDVVATDVVGITRRGIIGNYTLVSKSGGVQIYNCYIRSLGVFHSIGLPNSNGYITAVNDNGDFVGEYLDTMGGTHGFIATCAVDQQPCTQ